MLDYDTTETVICTSEFIYNAERQRSLQHFIQLEPLPQQYTIVNLPSGNTMHHGAILPVIYRTLRSLWVPGSASKKANAISNTGKRVLVLLAVQRSAAVQL